METLALVPPAVTDRLQARIAELERVVVERTDQLNAAVRELETFSHSVSHDLRAPLRGIVGYARSLAEDHAAQLSEQGRQTVRRISDEAQRMSQQIADLGAFSRVGRQALSAAEIDMTELARSAFQELAEPLTSPAPSLEIEALPSARGDRAMVRVLLSHLLGNAIKFTRGRTHPCIRVTSTVKDGWATYCVADNGIGFDIRYAHRLFGVFQQLHRPEDFPGTGVGLAVVRRIAQRHGGRTWADGMVNGGAHFFFTLPTNPDLPS